MSKVVFGNISGVPWSTAAETAYDVILESEEKANNTDVKTLENETGDIVLHVQDGKYAEITFEATIKGTNHIGTDALVGSVLTLTDADMPSPCIVTGNSHSKTKREWQKCRLTARYYGADFTTGTAEAGLITTTTGA